MSPLTFPFSPLSPLGGRRLPSPLRQRTVYAMGAETPSPSVTATRNPDQILTPEVREEISRFQQRPDYPDRKRDLTLGGWRLDFDGEGFSVRHRKDVARVTVEAGHPEFNKLNLSGYPFGADSVAQLSFLITQLGGIGNLRQILERHPKLLDAANASLPNLGATSGRLVIAPDGKVSRVEGFETGGTPKLEPSRIFEEGGEAGDTVRATTDRYSVDLPSVDEVTAMTAASLLRNSSDPLNLGPALLDPIVSALTIKLTRENLNDLGLHIDSGGSIPLRPEIKVFLTALNNREISLEAKAFLAADLSSPEDLRVLERLIVEGDLTHKTVQEWKSDRETTPQWATFLTTNIGQAYAALEGVGLMTPAVAESLLEGVRVAETGAIEGLVNLKRELNAQNLSQSLADRWEKVPGTMQLLVIGGGILFALKNEKLAGGVLVGGAAYLMFEDDIKEAMAHTDVSATVASMRDLISTGADVPDSGDLPIQYGLLEGESATVVAAEVQRQFNGDLRALWEEGDQQLSSYGRALQNLRGQMEGPTREVDQFITEMKLDDISLQNKSLFLAFAAMGGMSESSLSTADILSGDRLDALLPYAQRGYELAQEDSTGATMSSMIASSLGLVERSNVFRDLALGGRELLRDTVTWVNHVTYMGEHFEPSRTGGNVDLIYYPEPEDKESQSFTIPMTDEAWEAVNTPEGIQLTEVDGMANARMYRDPSGRILLSYDQTGPNPEAPGQRVTVTVMQTTLGVLDSLSQMTQASLEEMGYVASSYELSLVDEADLTDRERGNYGIPDASEGVRVYALQAENSADPGAPIAYLWSDPGGQIGEFQKAILLDKQDEYFVTVGGAIVERSGDNSPGEIILNTNHYGLRAANAFAEGGADYFSDAFQSFNGAEIRDGALMIQSATGEYVPILTKDQLDSDDGLTQKNIDENLGKEGLESFQISLSGEPVEVRLKVIGSNLYFKEVIDDPDTATAGPRYWLAYADSDGTMDYMGDRITGALRETEEALYYHAAVDLREDGSAILDPVALQVALNNHDTLRPEAKEAFESVIQSLPSNTTHALIVPGSEPYYTRINPVLRANLQSNGVNSPSGRWRTSLQTTAEGDVVLEYVESSPGGDRSSTTETITLISADSALTEAYVASKEAIAPHVVDALYNDADNLYLPRAGYEIVGDTLYNVAEGIPVAKFTQGEPGASGVWTLVGSPTGYDIDSSTGIPKKGSDPLLSRIENPWPDLRSTSETIGDAASATTDAASSAYQWTRESFASLSQALTFESFAFETLPGSYALFEALDDDNQRGKLRELLNNPAIQRMQMQMTGEFLYSLEDGVLGLGSLGDPSPEFQHASMIAQTLFAEKIFATVQSGGDVGDVESWYSRLTVTDEDRAGWDVLGDFDSYDAATLSALAAAVVPALRSRLGPGVLTAGLAGGGLGFVLGVPVLMLVGKILKETIGELKQTGGDFAENVEALRGNILSMSDAQWQQIYSSLLKSTSPEGIPDGVSDQFSIFRTAVLSAPDYRVPGVTPAVALPYGDSRRIDFYNAVFTTLKKNPETNDLNAVITDAWSTISGS